jgi:hypothetical protein
MSKHQLLQHWPQVEIVRDVAKIVGFAQFYCKFIPQFKLCIAPLCNLTMKFEYIEPVTPHWTTATQDFLKDIQRAVLSDPCLQRFNYKQLIVLRSDFLSKGFGYVLCQPGNDDALTEAMNAYHSSANFSFYNQDIHGCPSSSFISVLGSAAAMRSAYIHT